MLAHDAAPGDFQADSHACRSAGGDERVFADELLFAQFDAEIKAGFERRDGRVHLVAVQRHGRFQAQRVAGAQAAGDAAEFLAGLAQRAPHGRRVGCGGVDLVAQLAGVAGAGNHAFDAVDLGRFHGGVVLLGNLLGGQQPRDDLGRLGALQRNLRHVLGDVVELGVGQDVLRQVFEVLGAVGGVDHHQVRFLAELVDDQVIHAAAVLVAQHGIAHAPDGHVGEVVGEHVVQGCERAGAAHREFAHVGHVEQAACLAHGHVLGDDAAAVLHGQQVSGEGDDLAAFLNVDVVQGCFQFAHGSPLG